MIMEGKIIWKTIGVEYNRGRMVLKSGRMGYRCDNDTREINKNGI